MENLAGVSTRRKVRLRWYGDDTTKVQGVFEVKCKRNMNGWKVSQPLVRELDLSELVWTELIAAIRAELTHDLQAHLDSTGSPVVLNRYQREYYVSFDGKLRVTLDYSQVAFDQRHSSYPNLRLPLPPSNEIVIEFKVSAENRHRSARMISAFPLRMSKYSKYSRGVESLLGY